MKKYDFPSIPDEELASMAAGGNQAAMDFLLKKHTKLVRIIARSFFLYGGDSDDVVQEGMIGLFKAVRDFDADKGVSFLSFARLCVRRQIISAIKTANCTKNSPLNEALSIDGDEEEGSPSLQLVEDGANPETILIEQEALFSTKDKLFRDLSSFEKKVLALFLQGKTYLEISEILAKPPKSIDNAIQRIKRKLADLI